MPTDAYVYELLPTYYDRHFPFDDLVTWMGGAEKNRKREITFQLPPEIYIRFNSYSDATAWKTAVMKNKPDRMEIGPVYSHEPRTKDGIHKDMFYPTERELIFDIDMDDYDEVRTCCTGAKLCHKCWTFLKAAMILLRNILIEDFGFEHFMFVYSGRRGVHCWVSDESAMKLTNDQRSAIIEYINLFNVQSNQIQNIRLEKHGATTLHPHVTRSVKLLEPFLLDKILPEQEPLNPPLANNKHLMCIEQVLSATNKDQLASQFKDFCSKVEQRKKESSKSVDVYRFVEKVSKDEQQAASENRSGYGKSNQGNSEALQHLQYETLLRLLFPRLDVNVTKQMNHLAKCPFCIHPKTGRVCVPIIDIENFDFETVPTLGNLIDEIEANIPIEKSCLQKYLAWFSKYCGKLKKQADESTVAAKMTTKNKNTAMQRKGIVLVVFLHVNTSSA
ncbi:unnamed protein product [Amoebophrya sp. A120]|nr:unnamed protein product [Amoebophrya sp. A120]|eukprot:GSA120T00025912001.1